VADDIHKFSKYDTTTSLMPHYRLPNTHAPAKIARTHKSILLTKTNPTTYCRTTQY
jgi:hypothetical protein